MRYCLAPVRRALTLVELLIVTAILVVIIGLLVPAVQKVREAGRRTSCQNNLRQIVLGATNYESSNKWYPSGAGALPLYKVNAPADAVPAVPGSGRPPAKERPSQLVLLLPYLEQGAKYDQFDLTRDVLEDKRNATARVGDVPIYLCPSDPGDATYTLPGDPGPCGRANYMGNMGRQPTPWTREGNIGGIFFARSTRPQWVENENQPLAVRTLDVTDGTSNTAMFAEIKRGLCGGTTDHRTICPPDSPPYVPQDVFKTSTVMIQLPDPTVLPADCTRIPTEIPVGAVWRYVGLQYFRFDAMTSLYSHAKAPNDPTMDCYDWYSGFITSRSYHPGGVNVGFCDGSVRFIGNSIDLTTWQYIGSRADGKALTIPGDQ